MRVAAVAVILFAAVGCGTNTTAPSSSPPYNGPINCLRQYVGTTPEGDYLTVALDSVARTITYDSIATGEHVTVPYTIAADGSYRLNDPSDNLQMAREVPNQMLLIQAAKNGARQASPALIVALPNDGPSSGAWLNRSNNYMQFRTAAQGLEIGSATLDGSGNLQQDSYRPSGTATGGTAFIQRSFPIGQFRAESSDPLPNPADYSGGDSMFGTPNGVFATDTPSGAILGLKKASQKDFDPAYAGIYQAVFYRKSNTSMGAGEADAGSPALGEATLTISDTGQVILQDHRGDLLAQALLIPVADVPYLYGNGHDGKLADPCYGLFTFRITGNNSQQDVFVGFTSGAALFMSYRTTLPLNRSSLDDYWYGVGIKTM